MKFSILAASLASASIASAKPTSTTPAATSVGPAAACFYSPVAPSTTAYVANMPNNNLTNPQINQFFNNFMFTCEAGRNFTAYRLATSTLTPKPWFGGDVYYPGAPCSVGGFESLVGQAMQYMNSGANTAVTCNQYTGGTANAFQQEAQKYFASVKRS